MADRRRGLGRGLGALIPGGSSGDSRPVDVFFPDSDAPDGPAGRDVPGPGVGGSPPDAVDGTARDHGVDGQRGGPAQESTAADARTARFADGERGASTQETTGTGSRTAPLGDGGGRALEQDEGNGQGGTEGLVEVPGVTFAEIPVGLIRPNPRQPRTVFDEEALTELVGSIREIGVLQPVVVRPVPDGELSYELIMGERRWRATQDAGLATIPAIIRHTEDADLLRDALLENLHRSQLNALEEAAAYQQLLDDFGCTHEELAQRIHRSRPQISNTLRLLRLPPLVQRRVAAGVLSAGHARALLGLADAAAMERLAQRIVAEGLSVRATEEVVSLGGDAVRQSVVRRSHGGERSGALDDLAARLADRLETRVKVVLGRSKGSVTVEFASVDDLNRILGVLAPDDPGVPRTPMEADA